MTTVGTSFRIWFYEKGGKKALRPFHGDPAVGDGSQYIDAKSSAAEVLPRCIGMMKEDIPLRYAPTLPSQSLSDLQPAHGSQKGIADDEMWDEQGYAEASTSAQPYQQVSQPADGGTTGSVGGRVNRAVQTKIRREEHTLRPNEYVFKDAKGQTRRTTKKDWTRIRYDGKKARACHGKKTTYISDIEIQ